MQCRKVETQLQKNKRLAREAKEAEAARLAEIKRQEEAARREEAERLRIEKEKQDRLDRRAIRVRDGTHIKSTPCAQHRFTMPNTPCIRIALRAQGIAALMVFRYKKSCQSFWSGMWHSLIA